MDIFSCLKEKSAGFSKGQKHIAAYIQEHREEASVSTAAKIAKTVGVSESTVVRFALELGYSGYPEMQKALQEHIFGKKSAFAEADGIRRALYQDSAALRTLEETLNQDFLRTAVEATAAAGTVFVYGHGQAAFLAELLQNALLEFRPRVRLLQSRTRDNLCLELLEAQDGDVLLCLSTPSGGKSKALELAAEMGCLTVSLGCAGGDYAFFSGEDRKNLLPVSLLSLLHAFLGGMQDLRKDARAERAAQISEISGHWKGESHEL